MLQNALKASKFSFSIVNGSFSEKCSLGAPVNILFRECVFLWKTLIQLEVMSIWKSYMRTAGWTIIWNKIIAVIDATFAVAKRRPEMNLSGFLFATTKVPSITVMIFFRLFHVIIQLVYKHLVHINHLFRSSRKLKVPSYAAAASSKLFFCCFHFITHKKTCNRKKCSSDRDDAPGRRLFCCLIEKKPTRVSWCIFMFFKAVKQLKQER